MAGPVQPIVFPVMWARDASASFLRTPEAMRKVMEGAGFAVQAWDDVTEGAVGPSTGAPKLADSIPRIVMGDPLDEIMKAGQRNREERRIVMIQAVMRKLRSRSASIGR